MQNVFRWSALVVSILFALTQFSFAYQLSHFLTWSTQGLIVASISVFNILLVVPFILLLALIFRYPVTPSVPSRKGFFALAMAAGMTAIAISHSIRVLPQLRIHYPSIDDMAGTTEAEHFWHWLVANSVGDLASKTVNLLWLLAFMVFLVSLGFSSTRSTNPTNAPTRTIQIIALVSALACSFSVLTGLLQLVFYSHYAYLSYTDGQTRSPIFMIARVLFGNLPIFCMAGASWIIRAGVGPQKATNLQATAVLPQ